MTKVRPTKRHLKEMQEALKPEIEKACVSPTGHHCIHYDLNEDCCFCGKRRVPAKQRGKQK